MSNEEPTSIPKPIYATKWLFDADNLCLIDGYDGEMPQYVLDEVVEAVNAHEVLMAVYIHVKQRHGDGELGCELCVLVAAADLMLQSEGATD